MTAPRPFRPAMAWLHAWSGLVVGWALFAVFVTGTASYYRDDITRWMRPELTETAVDPVQAATTAGAFLARQMPDAAGWYVVMPKPEMPATEVHWWKSLEGPFHRALLDPATGETARVRDTRGGDFLYRFHYELSLPPLWGRWIVAICAMVLLVALISGIVTHRRIFADFFTFRRDRSAQRGWLDAHNVVGVLALPFHLMITYSGLVTLAPLLMPWGPQVAYGGDVLRYYAEAGLMPATRMPAGRPGTPPSLGEILARAVRDGGEAPEALLATMPGDAAGTVTAVFEEPHGLAHLHPQIAYDVGSGAEVARTGAAGGATRTGAVMIGLHEAHFAAPALRALFMLCGAMGAATVATGLVLWAVARTPKVAHPAGFGLRLVRILNLGAIAGLPTALAAYFLANRLLPLGLAERAAWETRTFFAAWALTALLCALLPRTRGWPVGLGLAAAAFAVVPVADAVLVGEARFLGFDLAMALLALLLALGARLSLRVPGRLRGASIPEGTARA
ncbi:PepSY-associated TM helix domain-containing protein [Methylobacterium sp. NEAU 140]|uniref:PepSY-associated TM helix domain-containing protein n=1 Tax=Methylobacterium sp. NEAU 140 TaxID=3064945 RepID=UPI0027365619|nr:PepSY-associated TM helix domain-containing protein [Methylobacterium sp. NEAU 140]MDP4023805.1 PepSY-associated TM helix domain-containing protein [Methylobacterium sp. NEAU 140]